MSYELKSALSKVGPTPMKFGVYKGTKGVQILISQGAPNQTLLSDMMTQTGINKPLLQGKCFKEESKYIFASKAGDHAIQITNAMKAHASGVQYELRDLHGDDEESTDSSHTDSEHEGQPGWQNIKPTQGQVPRQVGQMTNRQNTTTTTTTQVPKPGTGQQGVNQGRPLPPTPGQQGGTQNRTTPPNTNQQGGTQNRTTPPIPGQQGGTQNRTTPPIPGQQGGTQNRTTPPIPGQQGGTQNRTTPPIPGQQGGTQNRTTPPIPGQQGGTQNRTTPPIPGQQGGTQNRTTPPIPGQQGSTQNRTTPPNTGQQGGTQNRTTPPNTGQQGGTQTRTTPPNPNQQQGGTQSTVPPPRPQRPPKRVTVDDGTKTVNTRLDTSLKESDISAKSIARNAFTQGSAQRANTTLSTKPVNVDRKGLSKMTDKKQGQDYIKNGGGAVNRPKREAQIKEERKAAANMAKAMKKAFGKKPQPKHLDALETACREAVDSFSKRVKTKIQNAQGGLDTATSDTAKAEAQQRLDNALNGPEANRLASTIDALLDAKLRKNEKLIADFGAALQTAENETPKTEATLAKVQELASEYRKLFAEHAVEYEKLPGRQRPQAVLQQEKMVQDILDESDAALFSLKQTRLGPPPWDPTKQDEGNELIDKGREISAKDLLKNGKVSRPKGGSSDVIVLKDGQDKTKFAFKSVNGESSQMGLEKGSGAIREAVSSKIAETVLQQTGLDFGFPKVSIATLEGQVGCLVEGINGKELPPPDKDPDKAGTARFQNAIPGKQLQKTICAGLAMGNIFDMKWDNVFWEGQGDQINARPFDAGAAFLPTSEINYTMYGRPGQKPGFDIPLLIDAEGKTVQGAKEPMDKELMDAMLKIDVVAIGKAIDDELKRNSSSGLDKFIDDDSKKNGLQCLITLRGVLHAHKDDSPAPSLETVMAEVQAEIMKAFPPPK
jgi:hypothetical protein